MSFGGFRENRGFAFLGGMSQLLVQKSYVVIKGGWGVICSTFSSSDSSSSSNKEAPHTDVHLYGAERRWASLADLEDWAFTSNHFF